MIEPGECGAALGEAVIAEGDWLSMDADAGAIYLGERQIVVERPQTEFDEVSRWRAMI